MSSPCIGKDEKGRYRIRGSGLGCSQHDLVRALRGEECPPTPSFLEPIFEAGHKSEARVKQYLRERGVTLRYADCSWQNQYCARLEGKRWVVEAHPDGLISLHNNPLRLKEFCARYPGLVGWSGEEAIYEHKALNRDGFEAFQRGDVKEAYRWQCSAAMRATDKPLVASVEWRDSEDRKPRLTGELCFFYFGTAWYREDEIGARIEAAIDIAESDALPPPHEDAEGWPSRYDDRTAPEYQETEGTTARLIRAFIECNEDFNLAKNMLLQTKQALDDLPAGHYRAGDVLLSVRVHDYPSGPRRYLTVKRNV